MHTYMHMYVCVCACACAYAYACLCVRVHLCALFLLRPDSVGIPGSCEPANMGAGNRTCVLWKNMKTLSCISGPTTDFISYRLGLFALREVSPVN